ncbi:tryptophan synthase beta subunit-like PLP-dependent enzyme [Annulohypoxylon stygium]|nr:tryptophan synthase beta subunit-like PLP-dependent enzyme [Annulohypoxylon stygium]
MSPSQSPSPFIHLNPPAREWVSESKSDGAESGVVLAFHKTLPGYNETKLHSLPDLANELGLGYVLLKDESDRCGLSAFKILGVSWAIYRSVGSHLGLPVADGSVSLAELAAKANESGIEIVTATEGNCGRAVSYIAAELMGLETMVFVPNYMDEKVTAEMTNEGSEVLEVDGDYDDVVSFAFEEAKAKENRLLILDVGLEGYDTIPRYFVEGYSTMLAESDRQVLESTGGKTATHAIVPVGAGSVGEAVTTHFKNDARVREFGPTRVLGVEPTTAACLFASLKAAKSVSVPTEETIMRGLNCGTLSTIAWPILRDGIDAAVMVSDLESHNAVRELSGCDISAGPCGAATLTALRKVCVDAKQDLGLDDTSIVVLYCTEGEREYVTPF